MKRILVIGATGQIGIELTPALRSRYGEENVIAAGHRRDPDPAFRDSGPYVALDVRDRDSLVALVEAGGIDAMYHLAAILSAAAESRPRPAWDLNMNGLLHVLEVAESHRCAVFFPSSIGTFGPSTPRRNTPQVTIQRPRTMYGVTKTAGELLCDYYHLRFGVDARGVRFPGLISYAALPGGGTTDYAVDIFYAALRKEKYVCPLRPSTRLDMMYMPDAIRAALEVMEADPGKLGFRNAYNVTAMSFSPEELYREIKRHLPGFAMTVSVDPVRQAIADSWPEKMDDSAAREHWGWQPRYDLPTMVEDMLEKLSARLGKKVGMKNAE
jgi:nucleoside-diphosphate-sugar epimerase